GPSGRGRAPRRRHPRRRAAVGEPDEAPRPRRPQPAGRAGREGRRVPGRDGEDPVPRRVERRAALGARRRDAPLRSDAAGVRGLARRRVRREAGGAGARGSAVGDAPTVSFVDGALRALAERPLYVLALARPEIHTLFPALWRERGVQEVRLGELGRRASERLVRAVLGEDTPAELQAEPSERAAGNALYLEELIRAEAEGKREGRPETVLAMVQARLEGLPAGARQVLRAASVFGQVFWRGGVGALLPGETDVADWLADLARREVVGARGAPRFSGESEHVFRHGVVREAAYAMLTEADRALGHRLAGEWLERMGESEAHLLAEHFERGDDAVRAAGWYRRAAEQAL